MHYSLDGGAVAHPTTTTLPEGAHPLGVLPEHRLHTTRPHLVPLATIPLQRPVAVTTLLPHPPLERQLQVPWVALRLTILAQRRSLTMRRLQGIMLRPRRVILWIVLHRDLLRHTRNMGLRLRVRRHQVLGRRIRHMMTVRDMSKSLEGENLWGADTI